MTQYVVQLGQILARLPFDTSNDGKRLSQDASEYFQYLLDIMTKAERISGSRLGQALDRSSASAFEFGIETRVQCTESGRVSYKNDAPTNILSLNIPVDAAANKREVDQYKVGVIGRGPAYSACCVLL